MEAHYICCHECDEISRLPYPHKPGRYKCPNCGHTLFKYWPGMFEKIYALNLAALFLFVVTNMFPFLSFHVLGNASEATFSTAILYLYHDEDYLLAVAVFLTTLLVPLTRILLYLLLFGPLYHGIVPRYAAGMLKLLETLLPWGMLDVFMVGVLVSIVKLVKMGTIIPGISLWSFAALIVVMAYAQSLFDPHPVWERIDEARGRTPDSLPGAAS